MKYIKILEPEPAIVLEYLKYLEDEGFSVVSFDDKIENDKVYAIMIRSQVFVNAKLLDKYPNLHYVLRVGVGLDSIDLEACKKRNIIVKNTPGANSDSVADMAVWGLLSLLRNSKKIILDSDKQKFDSRFSYTGFEMSDLVIGIVGFGKIGRKFYERCLSFGVKKFYIIDPFLTKDDVKSFEYCEKVELIDIVDKIDVLSLFVPLSEITKNLINSENLDLCKKNIKIMNLGRGGVINELDLYNFLVGNPYASAYLDVRKNDPELTEIVVDLMKLGNCIVSPHIATMTKQAIKKMHYFQI